MAVRAAVRAAVWVCVVGLAAAHLANTDFIRRYQFNKIMATCFGPLKYREYLARIVAAERECRLQAPPSMAAMMADLLAPPAPDHDLMEQLIFPDEDLITEENLPDEGYMMPVPLIINDYDGESGIEEEQRVEGGDESAGILPVLPVIVDVGGDEGDDTERLSFGIDPRIAVSNDYEEEYEAESDGDGGMPIPMLMTLDAGDEVEGGLGLDGSEDRLVFPIPQLNPQPVFEESISGLGGVENVDGGGLGGFIGMMDGVKEMMDGIFGRITEIGGLEVNEGVENDSEGSITQNGGGDEVDGGDDSGDIMGVHDMMGEADPSMNEIDSDMDTAERNDGDGGETEQTEDGTNSLNDDNEEMQDEGVEDTTEAITEQPTEKPDDELTPLGRSADSRGSAKTLQYHGFGTQARGFNTHAHRGPNPLSYAQSPINPGLNPLSYGLSGSPSGHGARGGPVVPGQYRGGAGNAVPPGLPQGQGHGYLSGYGTHRVLPLHGSGFSGKASTLSTTLTHLDAAVGNFTCVLRRLNLVDDALDVLHHNVLRAVHAYTLNPYLKQDLIQGIHQCSYATQCQPDDKLGSAYPYKLQRLLAFHKCERKARLTACLKQDLRRNIKDFDTSVLPDDGGRTGDLEKLLTIIVGSESTEDLEFY